MITKAEIIEQPYSGQFKERIYDISNPWNSQDWTWIKFEDENYNEWCGQFRGAQQAVALSSKHNKVLVATFDYLFQIDCVSGEMTEYESINTYQDLTVTPFGDFIITDYYNIEIIGKTINDRQLLYIPIAIDMIKFNGWSENTLSISCEELGIVDSKIELELDVTTFEINILSRIYK
ncbi:hypothetical protein JFL43_14910 [Viridibacillus sp. YIM B01967]|uniref:Uncharacterized protein n=1 Tax=Viridibacillus soli TaxID=2798301 RepID=A0ABS1H9N4_9BACL|nr:hypothetical protein [Viridibacillus soli]MBK3496125.1 hypothetical protein [Viridibacillus soli]